MGSMEKAGVAVVGIVICIIVAVGLLSKHDGKNERSDDKSKKAAGLERDDERRRRRGAGNPLGRNDRNRGSKTDVGAGKETAAGSRKSSDSGAEIPRRPGRIDGPVDKTSSPGGSGNSSGTAASAKKPSTPGGIWPKSYTISNEDALGLGRIASKVYKTSSAVDHIVAANPGLDTRRLRIGQVIKLPAPTAAMIHRAKPVADGPDSTASKSKSTSRSNSKKASSSSSGTRRPTASSSGGRPSFITSSYLANYSDSSSSNKRKSNRGRAKSGGGTYTVEANDTLERIAERMLGSISYADDIFVLNRTTIRDKNRLQVGWVLNLPKTVN